MCPTFIVCKTPVKTLSISVIETISGQCEKVERVVPYPKHFKVKRTYHPSFQTRDDKVRPPPKCKSFIELRNAVVSTGLIFKPCSVGSFFSLRWDFENFCKAWWTSLSVAFSKILGEFLALPKFCSSIVFSFCKDNCYTWEKLETGYWVKNLGEGTNKIKFGNNVFS